MIPMDVTRSQSNAFKWSQILTVNVASPHCKCGQSSLLMWPVLTVNVARPHCKCGQSSL
uniref:Uncharacterized protein n=1 Tax=Oncorhynchus mykiss TaxID=8022 RepID=A0A8K9UT53_ONCMY